MFCVITMQYMGIYNLTDIAYDFIPLIGTEPFKRP